MSAPLWTRDEAVAATRGASLGPDWRAGGVAIDSRHVAAGDLFVALAGPNHDGHDFVGKALEAGAAAALCHRRPDTAPGGAPLLLVEDTLKGLAALGVAGRARSQATVIAVTGSVGKTSSKEMLAAALGSIGQTYASAASHNNHWGVPLSLSRLPPAARFAVFEVGMNHPGEIRPLVHLVRPQIALVTQIAPAHLEFFPDGLAGIANAKAEIFEGLPAGGTAVINADAPEADRLFARARAAGAAPLGFGRRGEAARLVSLRLLADGSELRAEIFGEPVTLRLSVPGEHMAMNALGVLAVCHAAGVMPERAVPALAAFRPLKGRGLRLPIEVAGGQALLIDDSYNANPASVTAALAVLGAAPLGPQGRRIAVLGDMLELGAEAAALHAEIARPVIEQGIDLVFCCGPAMRALWDALPAARRGAWAPDSAALAPAVAGALRAGDAVLVKGSLGSRMARIVQLLVPPAAA